MIESILLAALGFLAAVLLALLAAPVLWRRAVALTRQRVESSMPISRSEIQADKDRLRADFAMTARRLEIDVKTLRDKTISQSIELDRQRDKVRDLMAERATGEKHAAALEATLAEREAALSDRGEELEAVSAKFDEIRARMEEKSRELEEMSRMYEDASYSSSERQIALVARESEIDRLSDEFAALRRQRKEEERRMREAETVRMASEDGRENERRRADELDERLSSLMTTLSDREEKLERREKEMARLQQEAKSQAERAGKLAREVEAEKARAGRLEDALERSAAEIATLERHEKEVVRLQRDLLAETRRADGLARQIETLRATSGERAEDLQQKIAGAHGGLPEAGPADKATLEKRITALARENRALRARLRPSSPDKAAPADDALLRDQINELAAQVVQLTALADSPDSPLRRHLADPNPGEDNANGIPATSIADRVRALQKAASSRVN